MNQTSKQSCCEECVERWNDKPVNGACTAEYKCECHTPQSKSWEEEFDESVKQFIRENLEKREQEHHECVGDIDKLLEETRKKERTAVLEELYEIVKPDRGHKDIIMQSCLCLSDKNFKKLEKLFSLLNDKKEK